VCAAPPPATVGTWSCGGRLALVVMRSVFRYSVGAGRRFVRPVMGTVTRPRWQHCSGAFCAVSYRPSLDESFFPHLAAVQADRSLQGRAALAIAATEASNLLSTRTAAVCSYFILFFLTVIIYLLFPLLF